MLFEHSSSGPALLLGSSSARPASGSRRRRSSPCASITAANAAHLVYPPPLEVPGPLDAVLLAAAAARTALARGSAAPLRRARAKPATKQQHGSVSSNQRGSAAAATQATPAGLAGSSGVRQQLRAVQQFVAGGVAGAVSKTLVAPMERVSTMLMADSGKFSVGQAAKHAWATGLFRGHAATLVKIAPASAIQFAVFHGLKDRILASKQQRAAAAASAAASSSGGADPAAAQAAAAAVELANHERLLAGAAAGAASVCACYPLESCRTMMSVAGGVGGNLAQALTTIVRSRGVGALYRGFRATLVGDMMGNALGFTCYEIFNRVYADCFNGGKAAPPHLRGVIGSCSAACVVTLTMPLEVVKRRLQVQGLAGRPVLYRGTLDCLVKVLRTEGVGGFFAASLPCYLKVAPSIGCMYFLYELLTAGMNTLNTAAPTPAALEAKPAAAAK